jgi:hypothetical protein
MFLSALNTCFDDKRIMVCVVWIWLIVVLIVFTEMVQSPQSKKWGAAPHHTRSYLAMPFIFFTENSCT